MKLNNKGFLVGLGLIPTIWLGMSAILITHSQLPSVKDNFRAKKAVKMCVAEGNANCENYVRSLSKDAILAYIKDDAPVSNGGNFNNGYML